MGVIMEYSVGEDKEYIKSYSILIWGYEFHVEASLPEEAKRIAIEQYNRKPPDGVPVSAEKDADYIIWKEIRDDVWTDYQ